MAVYKRLSVEEKLQKIEQKRARLAEEAAKLRALERKKDAAGKIKLGGLIWKAGLKDESETVILGILVDGLANLETRRDEFEKLGRQKFDADERTKKAALPVVTVRFPGGPPPEEVRAELKARGFVYDAAKKHWALQAKLTPAQLETLHALPGAVVE